MPLSQDSQIRAQALRGLVGLLNEHSRLLQEDLDRLETTGDNDGFTPDVLSLILELTIQSMSKLLDYAAKTIPDDPQAFLENLKGFNEVRSARLEARNG